MDVTPLQSALISLIGALVVGLPLVLRALPGVFEKWATARVKVADAQKTAAEAQRITAEVAKEAQKDLHERLDASEAAHAACEQRIGHLEQQAKADSEVIAGFAAKISQDEGVIRGMLAELADLRRIVETGGVHA